MSSAGRQLTYKDAGVDIEAGDKFARQLERLAAPTRRPELLAGIGGFAALTRIPPGYRQPIIVTSTDGVGTKLKVAMALRKHTTIGIDLVAMCVNDILTVGAEPLCFLDYYATAHLEKAKAVAVLRGIARGCVEAGCSLAGGETAEMPSLCQPGQYELAGFAVGIVERSKIIDGSKIRPGDEIVGIASSGLHSNGYSLARKVLFERARLTPGARLPGLRSSLGTVLLRPTRIYVSAVREICRLGLVRGMAHVTGGGIAGNLVRIIPEGCRAVIRRGSWPVPPIFGAIAKLGNVTQMEMDRAFNNGIGFILVVAKGRQRRAISQLKQLGKKAYPIGSIEEGRRAVFFRD